ncbi:hypothetical protein MOF52_21705, partial [Bacillus inaquosorum]
EGIQAEAIVREIMSTVKVPVQRSSIR